METIDAGHAIRVASSTEDFESFRQIVLEYCDFLNVDLTFQVQKPHHLIGLLVV